MNWPLHRFLKEECGLEEVGVDRECVSCEMKGIGWMSGECDGPEEDNDTG